MASSGEVTADAAATPEEFQLSPQPYQGPGAPQEETVGDGGDDAANRGDSSGSVLTRPTGAEPTGEAARVTGSRPPSAQRRPSYLPRPSSRTRDQVAQGVPGDLRIRSREA